MCIDQKHFSSSSSFNSCKLLQNVLLHFFSWNTESQMNAYLKCPWYWSKPVSVDDRWSALHLFSCPICLSLPYRYVCHTCLHAVSVFWWQVKCAIPVFMLSMSFGYSWSVSHLSSCCQCLLTIGEVCQTCLHAVNVIWLQVLRVTSLLMLSVSVCWLQVKCCTPVFILSMSVCWLPVKCVTPVFMLSVSFGYTSCCQCHLVPSYPLCLSVDYRWRVPHLSSYPLHLSQLITGEVCHTSCDVYVSSVITEEKKCATPVFTPCVSVS